MLILQKLTDEQDKHKAVCMIERRQRNEIQWSEQHSARKGSAEEQNAPR